ncbi:AAA family ATPase [Deinococcus sp.]|uniref:AAA family ATPase n=1 Tax=Deinococcus sp. TaxID=47478 RepID=UPI003C7C7AFE
MRPTLHAVHGFIGAGKTTLARRLEAELPALRLNTDEWMVQLHGHDPPEEVFRAGIAGINRLIRQLAERALELGLNVVLDDGYWTRASRDGLRAWADGLGVPLRLYALSLSEGEAWRRVAQRNAEPGSLYVAPETFDLFWRQFEALGPDEAHETPP